jgi:hypothetical protein
MCLIVFVLFPEPIKVKFFLEGADVLSRGFGSSSPLFLPILHLKRLMLNGPTELSGQPKSFFLARNGVALEKMQSLLRF